MRWIHFTVIVLFIAFIIIFALQNLTPVLVSFLGFSLNIRVAVLVAILGAVTGGGSLLALLRRLYEGSWRVGSTSSTVSHHS